MIVSASTNSFFVQTLARSRGFSDRKKLWKQVLFLAYFGGIQPSEVKRMTRRERFAAIQQVAEWRQEEQKAMAKKQGGARMKRVRR